jgi:phosphopantothenoylcysteine decarboxylase/phosphopantothenate--cysteine ligase
MARILITSGPTRQYLDPVRYLTNASSGRMGRALAEAVIQAGHEAVIVSGPVEIDYPPEAEVHPILSTEDLLEECLSLFPDCDGMFGVAAPCDYRPIKTAAQKLSKTGSGLVMNLIETPDVIAMLGSIKQHQWIVAFALETQDQRIRAQQKLERKNADLIVLNGPDALDSTQTQVEVINPQGAVLADLEGKKSDVAAELFALVRRQFAHSFGQASA